jgi:signal transduction histidine kinase
VSIAVAVAAVRHLQAGEYAGGILAVVGPAAVGVVVRAQRERSAQLERLTVLLKRERDSRARAAVAEERARIAREIHDLVSHTLGVVAVQADAAQAALEAGSDRAGAPVAAIRAAAAEAMQEMRGLLGVLRGTDEDADRHPLPTIAALPALVERARLAGVSARLAVSGRPVAVLPSVDLTVYRIAQEAVTNAAKHAPGSDVEVCLRWLDEAIELRVRDNGPGPRGEPSPDAHGLVGMRERVRIQGGSLHAGPAAGGGFEVHAVLPVRPG